MVSFDNVSKFILKDVNLHIPAGETVGLIGASGAGKTTFIKLACGLLMPERGSNYTRGKNPLKKSNSLRKEIGVLFADKPIFEDGESILSNFKNLQIIYGLSSAVLKKEYRELSERLGFEKFENMRVKSLSLGQRRRAELGAVLLHRPKLLLLDEPTIGLDADAKQAFRELITERTKDGMSLLVTSHNMADIQQLCNRIAILHEGALLYYGGIERLLRKYAPMDIMYLKVQGKLPDMADLPLQKYVIANDELTLTYDSNSISSAEILRNLLAQTSVKEMSIHKSDLEDVILRIERERCFANIYNKSEKE